MSLSRAGVTVQAPSEAERPELDRRQINLVFLTVLLGILLAAMDQTIVSTALPTIVGDLGGSTNMSWVVTAYLLAQTIATVLAGKFGDMFGRRSIFIISVLIFVLGSLLCGLAQNMAFLILMRGVQGIGGGAMTVTASALIGDVIPLRDRARYQGTLGAVFGVTTVIGPLLGGLFTDRLSWRWAFYVNIPIAVVVLALAARTIPAPGSRGRPRVDYWGVVLVALGASGLTLATTWGGTRYAWGSPVIIALFAAATATVLVFIFVEMRVPEPILPMRLFRSRVFTTASLLSFVVGFAMLGGLTFLPSYLQFVHGATATTSGLRTLPMVLGLLLTSNVSGRIVGATGYYRGFPIVGCVLIATGLFLLSTMDANTSTVLQSLYMFAFGAGIGLAMQVLVIVVQNTVDYRDLGAATSGVTFFRTLGGAFGASIMGTVYANRLHTLLPGALGRAKISASAVDTPAAVHDLPAGKRGPIVHAYAETVHTVFFWATPLAIIGLVVALTLPRIRLRGLAREGARDTGEGFGAPTDVKSAEALETLISRVLRRRRYEAGGYMLRHAGVDVDRATVWGLIGVHVRQDVFGTPARQSDVERYIGVPYGVLTSFYDNLIDKGLLIRDGDTLDLTARGRAVVEALTDAWFSWLLEQLAGWTHNAQPFEVDDQMRNAVRSIASRSLREQQAELEPAVPGAPAP